MRCKLHELLFLHFSLLLFVRKIKQQKSHVIEKFNSYTKNDNSRFQEGVPLFPYTIVRSMLHCYSTLDIALRGRYQRKTLIVELVHVYFCFSTKKKEKRWKNNIKSKVLSISKTSLMNTTIDQVHFVPHEFQQR